MAEKQVGIAVLGFGTAGETWGLAENIVIGEESEKETIPDGDGDTTGIIYTDIREKVTADYLPLAAAGAGDPPKLTLSNIIGEEITIKTVDAETITFIVDGAEKKYAKGKVMGFSVNGYYYPGVAVA